MGSLSLATTTTSTTTTTTTTISKFRFFSIPCYKNSKNYRNLHFPQKQHRKLVVFAANDDSKLDSWDQMELKFGKLIGEDPKLTLAKIIGRKSNPELSYLEIEKLYNKKGGKGLNTEIEEVPFDVSDVRRKPANSLDGLNLTRPVPKKGVKFETNDKPIAPKVKRPNQPAAKAPNIPKETAPNIALRKPTTFKEDDVGARMSPRMTFKLNTSLQVSKEQDDERFVDMTLVRKPDPFMEKEKETREEAEKGVTTREIQTDISLLQKPEITVDQDYRDDTVSSSDFDDTEDSSSSVGLTGKADKNGLGLTSETGNAENTDLGSTYETRKVEKLDLGLTSEMGKAENYFLGLTSETGKAEKFDRGLTSEMGKAKKFDLDPSRGVVDVSKFQDFGQENDDLIVFSQGSQPFEQRDIGSTEESSAPKISPDVALRGPPKRLDQPVKEVSKIGRAVPGLVNPMPNENALKSENLPSIPFLKEREDADWKRAEDLIKTAGREEVELINSSTRGFMASFGSLIGFLPYRNLATKFKFLAFESWLRKRGLDPALYRQNLGIVGNYDATSRKTSPSSSIDPQKVEGELSPDMTLEDLLAIYDQEKVKFLSSFVGQKIKVNVVLADRESRKLIFSVKPKEKEESIERKRSLMAKLSIGDVVKCCIKKITYYGIFVEVEGVPALIHQTEVSWDATLDPASYYKIGQVVEAKVFQLDFSLQRIFLSLKEITPDPLIEALEAVDGDHGNLDGRLQAAELDNEWADVESLVKELQRHKGVDLVTKGRFFLSPGLAPTFQVYMASMFENQYKLLARAGNKVQEVIVETSMSKEEMKSVILTCTNKVK